MFPQQTLKLLLTKDRWGLGAWPAISEDQGGTKHGVWGRLKSPINMSLYLKCSVFTRAQHTWGAQRSQCCCLMKALSPLRRSQWWGHRQGSELSLQQPHTEE